MPNPKPYATATTQKRSRSSILKRTLNEDDIMADDLNDGVGGCSVAGRSKRVSFARTYKLKEFIKDADMLTLQSADVTSVPDQPVAPDNRTLYNTVAMEITMVSGPSAQAAEVPHGNGSGAAASLEHDFSAFLAAHENDGAINSERQPPDEEPATRVTADADVEDNSDGLLGDDVEDDLEADVDERRRRRASQLIGQVHQLLHHELGERILPMPNFSDTSSSESLKMATAMAATVAAFAVTTGSSTSGSSNMTLITSSSSATVSQHFYHHYQQHPHHQLQQQRQLLPYSRRDAEDEAALDEESFVSPDQPIQQRSKPEQQQEQQKQTPVEKSPSTVVTNSNANNANNSVLERFRELEDLFHSACDDVSPLSPPAKNAYAGADSSILAQIERSLLGSPSDSMSIVALTVHDCQQASNTGPDADSMSEASITLANGSVTKPSSGEDCGRAACASPPPASTRIDSSVSGISADLQASAAPAAVNMSLSYGRRTFPACQSSMETPSHLKSPSSPAASPPAVATPSFLRLYESAAAGSSCASPLLLARSGKPDRSPTLDELMRLASDSCFAGFNLDGSGISGSSAGVRLVAAVRQACDRLPSKFKDVLMGRLQLELQRCQVELALSQLHEPQQQQQQAEQLGTDDFYRKRLGEAAAELAAKLVPQILAGLRECHLGRKVSRKQFMKLRRRNWQCLMEKSRCLLSQSLYSMKANAMVSQAVQSSQSQAAELDRSRNSTCVAESFVDEPAAKISSSYVVQCAFNTVQYSVSEEPPTVTLKYLHSRLLINCRVLLTADCDASVSVDGDGKKTVLVQSFSCSVWNEGCTGCYADFLPLFRSTAKLVSCSLGYCCQGMPLAEFEKRAYSVVRPTFLLLLDFVRVRRAPCQVKLECFDESAATLTFVAMSRYRADSAKSAPSGCQPPALYRATVRICLPNLVAFFCPPDAALPVSVVGEDGRPEFSVSVQQRACGGLFDLFDCSALKGILTERIKEDRLHFLSGAFAACRAYFDSCTSAAATQAD